MNLNHPRVKRNHDKYQTAIYIYDIKCEISINHHAPSTSEPA